MKTIIVNALSVCVTLLFFAPLSFCEIYKYQDEKGNWHYTDTPRDVPESMEQVSGMVHAPSAQTNLTQKLIDTFKPQTAVETASIATVTVISAVGKGSGFKAT